MKRICVITGTRAEYGLLKPVLKKLNGIDTFQLQLIVTGMHLSPDFGMTIQLIERDGFRIAERPEILMSSDTSTGVSKSMGLALISFSEIYQRLAPDFILLLGDRSEIFAAASAAIPFKIPIGHIHGGEITEGAIDDIFRHCLTKMSYLHFTSTSEYRNRVIQLGEPPENVFNTGALGVENINQMELLTKKQLQDSIDFSLEDQYFLVTYHPETSCKQNIRKKFEIVLDAINRYKNYRIIFTKANSDEGGKLINTMIDEFVHEHSQKAISFTSMGQKRYLSALKYSSTVIGNSSSGIIEAPTFRVPTINIGLRQKGRIQADSVINVTHNYDLICNAIDKALSKEFIMKISNISNPYFKEKTSEIIVDKVSNFLSRENNNLRKYFYDIL